MHALALLAGVLLALWAPPPCTATLGAVMSCLGAMLLFTRWWRSGAFAVLGFFLVMATFWASVFWSDFHRFH